jgi:hypothetical protein
VNLAEAGEGLAGELADLLAAHPGSDPVILELTRPGDFVADLRVTRPRTVKADEEVIGRLRGLCGESAVLVEKQE